MANVSHVLQRAYMRNRAAFNEKDLDKAREILNLYGAVFTSKEGIRQEFDCGPDNVREMEERLKQHPSMLKLLKAQADQLAKLIELLEKFLGRRVHQLDPRWRPRQDKPKMATCSLVPETLPAYRALHRTFTAYLKELSKADPNQAEVRNRALRIAYIINPEAWRATGVVNAHGRYIIKFEDPLKRYFWALLYVPKGVLRRYSPQA